jgi:hypothetical protein
VGSRAVIAIHAILIALSLAAVYLISSPAIRLLGLTLAALLAVNAFVASRPLRPPEERRPRGSKPLWVLPAITAILLSTDLALHGYYGLPSLVAAAATLTVTAVARAAGKASNGQVIYAGIVVVVSMLVALYAVYAPSFGNDTYRDAIAALNLLKYEHYRPEYIGTPFLSMGYLYAVLSRIMGLGP